MTDVLALLQSEFLNAKTRATDSDNYATELSRHLAMGADWLTAHEALMREKFPAAFPVETVAVKDDPRDARLAQLTAENAELEAEILRQAGALATVRADFQLVTGELAILRGEIAAVRAATDTAAQPKTP